MRPIALVKLVSKSRVGGGGRAVVQRAVRAAGHDRCCWQAETKKKAVIPDLTADRSECLESVVTAAVKVPIAGFSTPFVNMMRAVGLGWSAVETANGYEHFEAGETKRRGRQGREKLAGACGRDRGGSAANKTNDICVWLTTKPMLLNPGAGEE